MQILRASEDYLETMLMMQTKHGYVRSVDVAEHLGVTKPSVTYATKRLRENGYIEMYNFPRADKTTITYARDNLSRKTFGTKL